MYKVILIDDEYMILQGLQKLIQWEQLGIELVGTFDDGIDALDYVRENPVDIVITDVSMPVMTGIEFVAQSQEEDINFNFIILSGYQEFEYVKEGIRLGAENFILKPIDTVELNGSIRKIVQKLDEEKYHEQGDEILFRNTIIRWLTGEIDSVDLRRILKQLGHRLELTDLYSVIAIGGVTDARKAVWNHFMKEMMIPYYAYMGEELYIVVEGSNLRFDQVRKGIIHLIIKEDEKIAIGDLFVKFDQIHRSYDHASALLEIVEFYDDDSYLRDQSIKDSTSIEMNAKISFEKFHQSLALGDGAGIREEMKGLIDEAIATNPQPEYIRYIAFIVFSDIYRHYNRMSSEHYYSNLKLLHGANSIGEILDVLESSIEVNHAQTDVKQYNVNVQKALQMIHQNYTDDLTIGTIADSLHLNAMYLGQIFKKETGLSFSQYLNQHRIKKAQNLLMQSSHNVNEIAELVGYTSSGYFYKNFKKECGISPREFRERWHKNGDVLHLD